MTKTRRTVSLDDEIDEYLSSEGVNASQLVNRLVKNHASSGGDKKAMLELRAEQLRSDISELESRMENKQSELDRVEDKLEEYQSEREEALEKAAEILTPRDLKRRNQKVRFWADRAEMSVDDFLEAIRDEQ